MVVGRLTLHYQYKDYIYLDQHLPVESALACSTLTMKETICGH